MKDTSGTHTGCLCVVLCGDYHLSTAMNTSATVVYMHLPFSCTYRFPQARKKPCSRLPEGSSMPGSKVFVLRGICRLAPNMASTKLRVFNPGTPLNFQLPLLRSPVQATPRERTQRTFTPTDPCINLVSMMPSPRGRRATCSA